jgi:DNA-binding MarR family transcriptional regulator
MDDPTACRIVKTLQDKGLVDSVPDPAHGRRHIISISRSGAKVAPALDALAEDLGRDLEAGLSETEQLQLRTVLLKVIANLVRPPGPTAVAETSTQA